MKHITKVGRFFFYYLTKSIMLCLGSAFTVKVTGEGRMKESITRKKRAASVANVGSQCDLSLKIPGEVTVKMFATETGTSNFIMK